MQAGHNTGHQLAELSLQWLFKYFIIGISMLPIQYCLRKNYFSYRKFYAAARVSCMLRNALMTVPHDIQLSNVTVPCSLILKETALAFIKRSYIWCLKFPLNKYSSSKYHGINKLTAL